MGLVLLQISILIDTVTIYIVHVDVEVLSMLLHFNKFHIVKLIIVEFKILINLLHLSMSITVK